MKKTWLLLLLLPLVNQLFAQSLSRSLGNLKSMKKITGGVILQTDFGNLKAAVYSASVIKIDITRNSSFDDFSYAVSALPDGEVKFTVTDEKEKITLSTDSLVLVISKKPVRVSLYNKDMQLVNGDDEAFGTSWIDDEITTYKKLFAGEKFIGLGEKTGGLNRRGNGYSHWNSDVPGYIVSADPLYSTIPFYIGIPDSLMYGIFLDNSSKTHFNFGASQERNSFFSTEAGDMNYYLIYNSSVAKIIESYTWLTGRMPLPPLWSLGFQQCRWSYFPQSEVLTLAQTFRDKNIPCDVIWFDIHYMERYKVFTWDNNRFPDHKGMLTKMDQLGFKNVVIIDPGIKVEKEYAAYEDGLKNDHFVKYPDGTVYSGQVWPGWCAFTDYTKPSSRIWWGKLFKENIDQGIDGFWCDMNEFATWGQKVPNNIQFEGDGHPITHKMAHNIYGLEMTRATFEGTKELLNGRRPFVLTRAGYAGLQRYTAIWTGDNVGTDDHMLLAVRMVSSLGVSGIPFSGADVSGFTTEATPELFARWISIAAFSPFYRSHKMFGLRDSEPWSYGEDIETIARNYISLRYRLLPYLYASFYEASQSGMPVQRTLAIDYPMDEKVYWGEFENEFLSGPSLLIASCKSTVRATNVYLPKGNWYDLYSGKKYSGATQFISDAPLEKLPVFVKEGSFIPMQSQIQTTAQQPTDTLVLHVYNSAVANQFIYYEDAGDRYDYQNGGFYKRVMSIDPALKQIVLNKAEGNFASH
ncbi:MAG TPA: glycoside hydrolase family 31 protein, partial [Chitinophagales bacterium]|nr:glycoside hydrolase family 31 protein [Chitinophagales bacterium]